MILTKESEGMSQCLTFLSSTRAGAPCLARYSLCLASISFSVAPNPERYEGDFKYCEIVCKHIKKLCTMSLCADASSLTDRKNLLRRSKQLESDTLRVVML